MVEDDDIVTLSVVHRQLVDAFTELDRAGRHAAAAHLLAAIELVEDEVGHAMNVGAELELESSVTLIARRMTQDFGDRAQSVARGQLANASGPAMLAWAAIINRIAK